MRNKIALVEGVSLAALTVALLVSQPGAALGQQDSPLAFVPPEQANYPSGERLESRYQDMGGVPAPGARAGTDGRSAALSAAAALQGQLPRGFTLGEGSSVRVMDEPSMAPMSGARAPGAAGTRTGGSQAKTVTLYPLRFESVPLAKGSDFMVVTDDAGGVLTTRERGVPAAVNGVSPEIPAEQATEAALADTGGGAARQPDQPAPSVRASEPELEIWVDENAAGQLAWTLTVENDNLTEPLARRYWVSAIGEPRVLHWESEIYHTHFGEASAALWEASPFATPGSRALEDLRITRSTPAGTVNTGSDGRFAFQTGTGNTQLSANLSGPNVLVQNQAGATMQVQRSGGATDPFAIHFAATDEQGLAQTSAFYWTNVAEQLAHGILAPADLPALPTRVNINNNCNAFWNGSSINFFRAGNGCPNTAYSDVVLHEYGHGVDHRKGGILDGGLSEGIGDAFAILGTRQSCLGRDFFGQGTCLRPAHEKIMWPPGPGEGVHAIGRRYAGFVWETVQQLKTVYGENGAFDLGRQLVTAVVAANPANIPDAVRLTFVMDDDDGNLANGTPHYRQLAEAAESRNLPYPQAIENVFASTDFPWSPVKSVSTNSNILEVSLSLPEPMRVLITADSSARTTGNAPLMFRTGFYNDANPNVMWTSSLRTATTTNANDWEPFASQAAINLPAGNSKIYWKIWVANGTLQFSSGSIAVEGMGASGTPLVVAEGFGEPVVTAEQVVAGAGMQPMQGPMQGMQGMNPMQPTDGMAGPVGMQAMRGMRGAAGMHGMPEIMGMHGSSGQPAIMDGGQNQPAGAPASASAAGDDLAGELDVDAGGQSITRSGGR